MKFTATAPPGSKKRLCDWCDAQATHTVWNHSTEWREYACDKHLEEHCTDPAEITASK